MEVGAVINQFEVVEHIGRGGMADVWSARDRRLNRMVAIKTIATGLSQEIDPVGMFKREAQTIAQMEHPHILPIYDVGEYKDNLYIVMRLVTGGSLEDLLSQGPLSLPETIKMGQAIASALDHAHTNKVIHLDLKPPNILLDSGRSPYVADFGLATTLDREGRARNPGSGTLLYMAPEQLVAEVIDHRADIYSFAIMLFHMLTGRLPFDGSAPLALKQLQYSEELPDLSAYNPNIPYQISELLRRASAQQAERRPNTLSEVIEDIQSVLSDSITLSTGEFDDYFSGSDVDLSTLPEASLADMALLEAVDIYTRARHAWAGGQGRFLLGITHYMLMSDYYGSAERYGLTIDTLGYQMLLRGAIEHDHNLDYWWEQLGDDDRRWVCLHAVRSENPTARIRALYRLETLPDDEQRPVIPKLVASALQVETYPEAKIAALQVLGTRSRLVKPHQEYQIQTQFRGNLLTTMTRLGIQVSSPLVWQEAVYSPEIDLLIAETALDNTAPHVAQFAARTIGRMHSLTAVRAIANAQRRGRSGALAALALVRDEAPYLPPVVSREGRLYAWLTNTLRRMADRPYETILRFILGMLGGWLAMGEWVFISFRTQALFTPQRLGNTFAIGLLFGLFTGFVALFAGQFPDRLRGFWAWWLRLAVFGVVALVLGVLAWSTFTSFFLGQPPDAELMRFGALGLVFGILLSSLLHLRGWQGFLLTAASVYATLYLTHYNYCQQFFICVADNGSAIAPMSLTPIAGVGLLCGAFIAWYGRRSTPSDDSAETIFPTTWPAWAQTLMSGLIGFGVSLGIWRLHEVIARQQMDAVRAYHAALDASGNALGVWVLGWDAVSILFILGLVVGLVVASLFRGRNRWAVLSVAAASYIAFWVTVGPAAQSPFIVPQYQQAFALLAYTDPSQVFSVGIPFALAIALGAHAQSIVGDLLESIGRPPHKVIERSGLLSVMLVYTLFISAVIGVMSLFSLHSDWRWALLWVLWGFVTFYMGLATWRWRLWGARGLLAMGVLLILGGFAANFYQFSLDFRAGKLPPLLYDPNIRLLWGAWAVATGVAVWGAMRRLLWGGIGLMALALAWVLLALFSGLPDFIAVFTVTNVALLAYALRADWEKFRPPTRAADTLPLPPQPIATPQREDDIATDPKVAGVPIAKPDMMMTEIDARANLDQTEDAPPTVLPDMRKELDPKPPSLKIDTSHLRDKPADAPKINIDTSHIRTARDARTEIDAKSAMNEPPRSDASKTTDVKISWDVLSDKSKGKTPSEEDEEDKDLG